jgi:hypothetical protein
MHCHAERTMVRGGDNDNITLIHPEFFAAHAVHALSRLLLEGKEWDTLQDIQNANCQGKQVDAVTKATKEL